MRIYRVLAFIFISVTTGLAAAFLLLLIRPDLIHIGDHTGSNIPAVISRTEGPVSYAQAVRRAAPSVVSIFATKITREAGRPLFNDPLLNRLFGNKLGKPRYKKENSLGSGVIINGNGFILTNHHVIASASEIQVVLSDGRSFPARIVGTDPETDLAVLQTAGDKLPVATLGRSDTLQVGDVVLAIGNPFAVGQTVTMGIVSATGRNQLGITNFENFIQTDAAINPGNSGGALINAHGDVVGINTAIFSKSGGSQGIGFAIPVKLAKEVLTQIADNGHVVRGWLGITGQDMSQALAETLEMDTDNGFLISGILENGPADQAGLEPGDAIVQINGEDILDSQQLQSLIAAARPGSLMKLQVMRDGNTARVIAKVQERPANLE